LSKHKHKVGRYRAPTSHELGEPLHLSGKNAKGAEKAEKKPLIDPFSVDRLEGTGGPFVSLAGRWIEMGPLGPEREKIPPAPTVEASEIIPLELQRQPADRGAFLTPVLRSDAIGRSLRLGVYLPPGYDPRSGERLPVLVLLPGRNNPLETWS
jgi:hypothetical protein